MRYKPVDLSVPADSGIDMYIDIPSGHYMPRMDYWFCGLQFYDDCEIAGRLKDAGFEVENKWDDHQRVWVGFRITGLQDGYCWPWEGE